MNEHFNEHIKQMTETSYQTAIRHYRENHACCPNCGSDDCVETLGSFPLDVNHPEKYKDLNDSRCCKCGHAHKVHDRTPRK